MKTQTFESLNTILINHYDCFNRERLWLDEYNENDGFVSIVHPTYDVVPFRLCKGIAKYIKKHIPFDSFPFIYVGAYFFKTDKL